MNLHRTKAGWDQYVQSMGYPTLENYLRIKYEEEQLSLERLGMNLGIRRDRVAQLLRKHNITVRGRGGVR